MTQRRTERSFALSRKKNKKKLDPQAHLNFLEGSYFEATSRPWYALVFLLPLIVIYELGTLLANTDHLTMTQSRVATFAWLSGLAEWIGVHRSLVWAFPPLVAMVILFCWHMVSHHPWRVRLKWFAGMAGECVLWTIPLFALGGLMNSSLNFAGSVQAAVTQAPEDPNGWGLYFANITTSIGAGIYEELVFRLILLGLLLMLFQDVLKTKPLPAIAISVTLSAVLFAAHHYIGFVEGRIGRLDEPFLPGSFIFRTLAGAWFAILFKWRGFGIIAGTHAAYDIIMFTMKQLW